jgi:hypothetical protein
MIYESVLVKSDVMFVWEADLCKRTWARGVVITFLCHSELACWAFVSGRYCTGQSFCPATLIALHLHRFAWQQAAQRSQQFHFALSLCPRVLFQCIAVNINFVPKFGMLSLGSQTRITPVNCDGLAVRALRASTWRHHCLVLLLIGR